MESNYLSGYISFTVIFQTDIKKRGSSQTNYSFEISIIPLLNRVIIYCISPYLLEVKIKYINKLKKYPSYPCTVESN